MSDKKFKYPNIAKRQLELLENSIVAADPTGKEQVIKDLRQQIFKLTNKLRKAYGYPYRNPNKLIDDPKTIPE